jgi:hypothetical protein
VAKGTFYGTATVECCPTRSFGYGLIDEPQGLSSVSIESIEDKCMEKIALVM